VTGVVVPEESGLGAGVLAVGVAVVMVLVRPDALVVGADERLVASLSPRVAGTRLLSHEGLSLHCAFGPANVETPRADAAESNAAPGTMTRTVRSAKALDVRFTHGCRRPRAEEGRPPAGSTLSGVVTERGAVRCETSCFPKALPPPPR
jgi:hypothetical protein